LPARKLVVSTYLQYIALALGVVLLVAFVRQVGGVLLTFPASSPTPSTPSCVASNSCASRAS
jgi:hypothetical protein